MGWGKVTIYGQFYLLKPIDYFQKTDLGFSKLSETGRCTAIGT